MARTDSFRRKQREASQNLVLARLALDQAALEAAKKLLTEGDAARYADAQTLIDTTNETLEARHVRALNGWRVAISGALVLGLIAGVILALVRPRGDTTAYLAVIGAAATVAVTWLFATRAVVRSSLGKE